MEYSSLKNVQPAPMFSKEQQLLRDLFGNPDNAIIFGNPYSECMPQVNGAIIPNRINGLPPDRYTSADLFGFGAMPKETARLFGMFR